MWWRFTVLGGQSQGKLLWSYPRRWFGKTLHLSFDWITSWCPGRGTAIYWGLTWTSTTRRSDYQGSKSNLTFSGIHPFSLQRLLPLLIPHPRWFLADINLPTPAVCSALLPQRCSIALGEWAGGWPTVPPDTWAPQTRLRLSTRRQCWEDGRSCKLSYSPAQGGQGPPGEPAGCQQAQALPEEQQVTVSEADPHIDIKSSAMWQSREKNGKKTRWVPLYHSVQFPLHPFFFLP